MAKLIYDLEGVRGRRLKLYDTKVVIITNKTVGSLLTGNFTDGEKTLYLCDIVGVQFKMSGNLIGYLQFETPSMQMNNQQNNMFSENTFTFEDGKNNITNYLMTEVYKYVTDRIEEIKYNTSVIEHDCNTVEKTKCTFEPKVGHEVLKTTKKADGGSENAQYTSTEKNTIICSECNCEQASNRSVCWNCGAKFKKKEEPQPVLPCPNCGEDLDFMGWDENALKERQVCPLCGKDITFNR